MESNKQNLVFRGMAILVLTVIFPLLISCPLFGESAQRIEPKYILNKVWTIQMDSLRATKGSPLKIANNLYLADSTRHDADHNMSISLEKIDITNGEQIWRSPPVPYSEDSSVSEWNGYLFIHAIDNSYNDGYLLCYDEKTGMQKATIRLGDSIEEAQDNSCWGSGMASTGNGLYWGSVSKRVNGAGLLYFDPTAIDFTLSSEQVQDIKPTLVVPTNLGIRTCPVEDNGMIFFLTHNLKYKDPNAIQSQLGAWDSKDGKIAWMLETPYFTGRSPHSLDVVGEILYIIDTTSPGAFDKRNGTVRFVNDRKNSNPAKKFHLGCSLISTGFTVSDGKIYYTNHMHSSTPSITDIPWDMVYNIVCIDAETGDLVWKNRPQGVFASLGTFPIVKDGKSYWVTDCGLRVYDAETGDLIGVDDSVVSYGKEHPAYYEGIMVFKDNDYTDNTSVLTAIRI